VLLSRRLKAPPKARKRRIINARNSKVERAPRTVKAERAFVQAKCKIIARIKTFSDRAGAI